VYNGRIVAFVDEMSSSYCLDTKCRLTEVDFTSSVVEVERRELIACQSAADTHRQTAEETQFIGDGDSGTLGVDGVHCTDLMTDRVDVYWTVQQSPILWQHQTATSREMRCHNV